MKAIDEQGRPLELTKIAGDCKGDDCEGVSRTDRGTAAVQGFTLHADTPDGESVVEVSIDVLLEAARAFLR